MHMVFMYVCAYHKMLSTLNYLSGHSNSAGSGLTTRHVEDISLGVLFLFKAAKQFHEQPHTVYAQPRMTSVVWLDT